jgi:5-amino-6-(5-phospho-D-ribitylamino)uracil phosphatase
MKPLYVSDLDGTLLNSEKVLTEFTANVINRFIAHGGLFTIATARMAYGCDKKLSSINLNIPGIIMNGACLYSFKDKKYLGVQTIEADRIQQIENVLDEHSCNAFMYAFDHEAMSIYYKQKPLEQDSQYLSKRAQDACREIRQVGSYSQAAGSRQIVYFASTGSEEMIRKVFNDLTKISSVESVMYLNIYNGLYCLEVFDEKANKANALMRLKQMLQVDAITAFGDNHNDISMMHAADFCFAPENAVDEVKKIANGMIESCDNYGVARFIQQKYDL